jgi:hypothetical protein
MTMGNTDARDPLEWIAGIFRGLAATAYVGEAVRVRLWDDGGKVAGAPTTTSGPCRGGSSSAIGDMDVDRRHGCEDAWISIGEGFCSVASRRP